MLIHDVDTPAVIIDLDKMERHIRDMAAHCRELDIPLRVHAKSHKIPEIAHMQLAAGAFGICCQKLGAAEVMVAAGIQDVLVPYNIIGRPKLERLLRLAKRAKITVACDSATIAEGISDYAREAGGSVGIFMELYTGRCGVVTPQAGLALARRIVDLPGLEFRGIMMFPSKIEMKPFVDETVALLRGDGIPAEVISGGGTGLESLSKQIGCTETRSGSYIWEGSRRIAGRQDLSPERCPLTVLTTVVSTPVPGRAIIDVGAKGLGFGTFPWGMCAEYPEIEISGLNVEHGFLDTSKSSHTLRVGERISLIPPHQESTLNLHDEVVGYRGEQVEVIWIVAGRGKVK